MERSHKKIGWGGGRYGGCKRGGRNNKNSSGDAKNGTRIKRQSRRGNDDGEESVPLWSGTLEVGSGRGGGGGG